MMVASDKNKQRQNLVTGYRPVVRAHEGLMLGIRQPLDGPIFEKLEDAEHWCIHAMISHYDRRLGMSEACIESFKGMRDCRPLPTPTRIRNITRIYSQVARACTGV
jgi:hypothetical protein